MTSPSSKRHKASAHAWSDEDVKNVEDLLTSGSGADEVCAVTGCASGDLDRLCMKAFGSGFEDVHERFQLVGHAKFNSALFEAACGGNAKAMEMYARTCMGYDPVSAHGRARAREEPAQPKRRLEL